MTLKFNYAHLKAIQHHAEKAYPHECCGVLVGEVCADRMKVVRQVIECANAESQAQGTRYSIDPHDLIRIQSDSRPNGSHIVGFYHSHPDHPAEWSAADLREAYWTGCSYVITSVESGAAISTRSFVLHGSGEEKYLEDEELLVDTTPLPFSNDS